ncbi:MAG TPA: hypothetical protein VFI25_15910 [Planctomycetota bacterium]|jgi:hypothetical protein|nr:hypothetical protein [Planctomycetota bacterium]
MRRPGILLSVLPAALPLGSPARTQCTNLAVPGLNGCGGFTPFGIPTIACAGTPSVGNASFAVTAVVPCTVSSPTLLVGTCLASPIVVLGPFGAGGFCGPSMARCIAFVGPTIFLALPGIATGLTSFTFPLPIPNDPTLIGASVCVQEVNFCNLGAGQCVGASQGISIAVL